LKYLKINPFFKNTNSNFEESSPGILVLYIGLLSNLFVTNTID